MFEDGWLVFATLGEMNLKNVVGVPEGIVGSNTYQCHIIFAITEKHVARLTRTKKSLM